MVQVCCMRKCVLLLLLLLLITGATSSERANDSKDTQHPSLITRMQSSVRDMAVPAMLALQLKANHSWLQQLRPDPKQQMFVPNRTSREVFSGHYVEVAPVPLPQPSLVIHRRV